MIPEMTDPLGRYWDQPSDIQEAPMDDQHVILRQSQLDVLPEYSATNPSGVYPGKCWKREVYDKPIWSGGKPTGEWLLCWYGEVPNRPDLCSNNIRSVLVLN